MVIEGQDGIDVRVRLLAIRKSTYTVYVFENLDATVSYKKYLMCTKCPNWQTDEISIGQEGFLKYKFVCAGLDTWWDQETDRYYKYKYTANYFINFVPLTHVIEGNMIVDFEQLIVT